MASPSKTSTITALTPRSGFFSAQFWIGLLAVVGTFTLGEYGQQIGKQLPLDFIQKMFHDQPNIIVGVLVVGAIAAFISISSFLETRTVRKSGVKNGKPTPFGGKQFYATSEFWLGLLTVVLNYLHDTGVFAPDIHSNATDTTTMLVALLYMFGRAQLKQAYSHAQADDQKV